MNLPTIEARVLSRRDEAVDVCSLELVDAGGRSLPDFDAGAHIDLHLPGGVVRQYSLCNPPGQTERYRIAVLREPASRGGSVAVHALGEGDHLRIGLPRNHFPLASAADQHILLAGGIGITPMLCMAHALACNDERFELHYCARSPARAAFSDEIGTSFGGRAHLHFDDGPESQRLKLDALLSSGSAATHLYVCGPAGFIDWVLGNARSAGWPEARLHREYFAAPAASASTAQADVDAFDVRIASSGIVIPVPAGNSVVDALRSRGIELPVSCEQGICGTCVVGVLAGTPDHRDLFLTPAEQAAGDRFTPCCSRSRSPLLVLDL